MYSTYNLQVVSLSDNIVKLDKWLRISKNTLQVFLHKKVLKEKINKHHCKIDTFFAFLGIWNKINLNVLTVQYIRYVSYYILNLTLCLYKLYSLYSLYDYDFYVKETQSNLIQNHLSGLVVYVYY